MDLQQILFCSVFLIFLFILVGLVHLITKPRNDPWFSYGNDPDVNCETCNGTGKLNTVPSIKYDPRTECDCPCTERIYY